jgi:O-antigen/teichoic acid export membrane protein
VNTPTPSVSKGILSVAAWSAIKIAASALASPLLARYLGPEGYGQYAYFLALLFLASPLANLGISAMLTRHIAERPGDAVWRTRLAIFAVGMMLLGTAGVSVLMVWLIGSHPETNADTLPLIVVVIGAMLSEQLWFFARGVLYGLRQESSFAAPAAWGAVLGPSIGLIFAWLGWGVVGVLLGLCLANFFVAAVTLRSAFRFLTWCWPRLDPAWPAHQLLTFSLSSMLFTTLSLGLYRADAILIRYLSTDTQAGLYAGAVQWSEFVWFVSLAVEAVMLQSTTRWWVEGHLDAIGDLLNRALRYVAVGTAFLLVLVVALAEPILRWYFGADFAAAAPALRWLAPGVFSFALARVMWPVIQARGNVWPLVVTITAAVGLNVLLNLWLTPRWGAAGAAVATCISYGSVAFVYIYLLQHHGVNPLAGLSLIRLGCLCAITLVSLWPIVAWMPSDMAAMLGGGVVAALIYGAGVVWLGLVRVPELQSLIAVLPAPFYELGMKVFGLLQPVLAWIEIAHVDR